MHLRKVVQEVNCARQMSTGGNFLIHVPQGSNANTHNFVFRAEKAHVGQFLVKEVVQVQEITYKEQRDFVWVTFLSRKGCKHDRKSEI